MNTMASKGDRPLGEDPPGGSGELRRLGEFKSEWLMVIAALAVFAFAFAPNLQDLFSIWMSDANYSHGLLVIPIAVMVFWNRVAGRSFKLPASETSRVWPSVVVLAALLLARMVAYERGTQWMETATMIPAFVCLVWTIGGGPLVRAAWPALAFLVFMLPLPQNVNTFIALPLQHIAATGSCFLLQLTGLWTIQQGNVIFLDTPSGTSQMDVEQACNGLKMLMTLAATITATILLIPMPGWKRIVLLVSALPIALASNIIRIFATGWSYYLLAGEWGKHLGHQWAGYAHDWSGFLMMPLALTLVGLELLILSWLIPQEAEDLEDDRGTILSRIAERKS